MPAISIGEAGEAELTYPCYLETEQNSFCVKLLADLIRVAY
jgi:hypothetical protein